eukprot:5679436-Pyramimonas_sp.AAC.1
MARKPPRARRARNDTESMITKGAFTPGMNWSRWETPSDASGAPCRRLPRLEWRVHGGCLRATRGRCA